MAEGGEQSLEINVGGEEILAFGENMFLLLNEKYGPGIEVPFSSPRISPYYNSIMGKTASFIYEVTKEETREILRKNYPFGSKQIDIETFHGWLENTWAQYHVDCGFFMNLFSTAAFVFEASLFAVERGFPLFYPCVSTLWSYLFATRYGEEFFASGGWELLKSDKSCALLHDLYSAQSQNINFNATLFRILVRDILPNFYRSRPVEGIEMETETRGACGFSATEGSYPKESAESFSPRKNKSSKKKGSTNKTLSCPVEGIEMKTETRGACGFSAPGGSSPKKSAESFSPRKNKSSEKKERTNETLSCPVEDIEMKTETRGAYPKKSAGSFSPGKNKSSKKEERTNETQSSSACYSARDDFSIKETPPELLQAGFPAFVFPDEHFSRKLLHLYSERSISIAEVMRRYKEHNRQPVEPQTVSTRERLDARTRVNLKKLFQSSGAVFSATNRKSPQKSKSSVSELTKSIGQLRVSCESSSKVKAEDDKTESLAVDSNEESECSEDENAENESEESSEEGNTQQRSPRKKGGKKKKGKGKGGKKKRKK